MRDFFLLFDFRLLPLSLICLIIFGKLKRLLTDKENDKKVMEEIVKINKVALLLALSGVFAFVACKSTEVEEPVVEPPVEETVEEVVEETPAPEPVVEAVDYSAANAKALATVEAAREKASAANAKDYYADEWAAAEKAFEEVKKNMAQDPTADYSAQLKDLADRYEALEKASQAQAMKKKADEMGFSEYDKVAYDNGAAALEKYAALGDASGADHKTQADAAYDSYKTLLKKGFVAIAGRERQASLEAKKQADSVKAGVAQKETYTEAAETFKKADSSYVTGNIEGAYEGYKGSKEVFLKLYATISEKRAAAQAAIDRAKQKVQETESYAAEADEIAPLAEKVAGIEDEGTVLLEEDQLANPDEAVIDVNSGVTAEVAEKTAETAIAAEEAAEEAASKAADALKNSASEAK